MSSPGMLGICSRTFWISRTFTAASAGAFAGPRKKPSAVPRPKGTSTRCPGWSCPASASGTE